MISNQYIQIVVFSKDRPLQLQATLESFLLQCEEAASTRVSIIYKASTDSFERAYARLRQQIKGSLDIEWVKEGNFRRDLLRQLIGTEEFPHIVRLFRWGQSVRKQSSFSYIAFLVDDCIFVHPFSLDSIVRALAENPRSIGFSLRLGKNTDYCYASNCRQQVPGFSKIGGAMRFSWVKESYDFNYPLEISSSVYRSEDIAPLLAKPRYSKPNQLEQSLSLSTRQFADSKYELLCFGRSAAFCAPVNKVQSVFENRAGSLRKNPSEELNSLFLRGYRINVASLSGFTPNSAHQEIDLPIERIG
jgi:hypothetical protein